MKTAFSLQARLFGEAERLCLEMLVLQAILRMTLGCKETLGRLGHYHKWPSCVVEGFVQLRESSLRFNQVWSFTDSSFPHAFSFFSEVVWPHLMECSQLTNLMSLICLKTRGSIQCTKTRRSSKGKPQQKNAISRALGSLRRLIRPSKFRFGWPGRRWRRQGIFTERFCSGCWPVSSKLFPENLGPLGTSMDLSPYLVCLLDSFWPIKVVYFQ